MTNWNWKMWLRWLLVTIVLLLKCLAFNHVLGITSAVLPMCAAAILIAWPVVWTQRKYIIWLVLGIVDLWLISNLIYYRANHLFLNWHVFAFATNLSGFESSILQYLDWKLALPLSASLLAIPCMFMECRRFGWKENVAILLLGVMVSFGGSVRRWRTFRCATYPNLNWEWINPCIVHTRLSEHISQMERQPNHYIKYHSILSYPLFMANDAWQAYRHRGELPVLTEAEEQELQKLIGPVVPAHPVSGNLLVVLLESFESWLMDMKDANGDPVCPQLNAYIQNHPVLYVKDLTTQVQYGMSGDGQMIVSTGLFTTLQGVACIDYGYNPYPNYAHFYPENAIINPCRNVWNKNVVTRSYGYQRLIEPVGDYTFEWNDSIVVDRTIEAFYTLQQPCCIFSLSISSHTPFELERDDIPLDETIPQLFQNYIRTAHYTDRHVGRLLAWADTAQVMKDAVIVVTGDHRIFHAQQNEETREYGLRANLPFGTSQAGNPLIVSAPGMKETRVVEQGGQVDVFPTILHFIGQEDYYWKGVGHNLWMEPTGTAEEIAIRRALSDKLIRMNYFEQYEKQ